MVTAKKNDNAVIDEMQTVEETQTKASQVSVKKAWKIRVANNPAYCGVGAGGVQFANGEAVIESERMAAWFKEHDGYEVVQQ